MWQGGEAVFCVHTQRYNVHCTYLAQRGGDVVVEGLGHVLEERGRKLQKHLQLDAGNDLTKGVGVKGRGGAGGGDEDEG